MLKYLCRSEHTFSGISECIKVKSVSRVISRPSNFHLDYLQHVKIGIGMS